MKKIKKTKIVATLGPASSSKDVIRDMIIAGVNVFRINFSHASFDDVRERIQYVRELNEELGFNVAILADLQGPKLRIGNMADGVVVSAGDTITFTTNKIETGNADHVYMNYKRFPKDVKKGERILLDDGKLIFEVLETDQNNEVVAKVIQGGALKSKKGVNLPNTNISLPCILNRKFIQIGARPSINCPYILLD